VEEKMWKNGYGSTAMKCGVRGIEGGNGGVNSEKGRGIEGGGI